MTTITKGVGYCQCRRRVSSLKKNDLLFDFLVKILFKSNSATLTCQPLADKKGFYVKTKMNMKKTKKLFLTASRICAILWAHIAWFSRRWFYIRYDEIFLLHSRNQQKCMTFFFYKHFSDVGKYNTSWLAFQVTCYL